MQAERSAGMIANDAVKIQTAGKTLEKVFKKVLEKRPKIRPTG